MLILWSRWIWTIVWRSNGEWTSLDIWLIGFFCYFSLPWYLSYNSFSNRRASEKRITALSMEPGVVLLVDNYRALHGRDVFQGDRFHASHGSLGMTMSSGEEMSTVL